IDALAPLQTVKDLLLFIAPVRWNHNENGFSDRLGGRIAIEALRRTIPARNPAAKILADDCVIRRINDGPEQKPGLFGFTAFSDVPRNAKLHDGAVRAAQWHRMCLHAAAPALQTDNVELKRALFPGTNALIEAPVPFAVLWRDEVVDASPDHVIGR